MTRRADLDPGSVTRRGFLKSAGTALLAPQLRSASPGKPGPAQEAEWTLERARREWKQMTRPVMHVGVPGYEWQAAVLWDGALVFGPLGFGFPSGHSSSLRDESNMLGNHMLHLSVGYGNPLIFMDRRGAGNPAIQLRLEEGRLPIPHVETKDGGLIWDEAVFAHLLDRKLDQGIDPQFNDLLIVHARFNVRNPTATPRTAHLWLHFGDTSQVQSMNKVCENDKAVGRALGHRFDAPFGFLDEEVRYVIPPPGKGKLNWHEVLPAPENMKDPLQKVIEWQVPLAAAEEAGMEIILPYGPVERQTAVGLLRLHSDTVWSEVRQFWKALEDGPASIATPDEFINAYAAGVVGQMAQQVGYRHNGDCWMYKTSPNQYENYWPCNAAKAIPTFDMRGLDRCSVRVLKSFVDTQTDDISGLTIERSTGKRGALKSEGFATVPGFLGNFQGWSANLIVFSHGLELWSLAAHYRVTRDRAWLGEGSGSPLQAMLEAVDWIATQRRRTMREVDGKKVAHWGLLPAATTDDWLSGNTICNDTCCIYGMIETVRALREIDHPRTEELARELQDYRKCLRARYTEARDRARPLPLPDGGQLPYVPRDIYETDWAHMRDWAYTRYGPPRAGAWGALDPHDELIDQSLAFLAAGMPKGEGFYLENFKTHFNQPTGDANFQSLNDPNAPRHFLWKYYVEYEMMWPTGPDLFLQRDDLPRFFECFFNYMAVAVPQGFRVGSESMDGTPATAPGESERWRAVRNMFVNERGGYDGSQQSLWLLQAIPRCWLKPGDHLAVKDMGTHFGGVVSLDAIVAKDGNSLAVSAKLDLSTTPTEIRMRLRSGDGHPLTTATVNGRKVQVLESDTIQLPAQLKGNYRIVGRWG